MSRRKDTPCADCGRPMWSGSSSLPPGQATCHPCRRRAKGRAPDQRIASKAKYVPETRSCKTCGTPFTARRASQIYCTPDCRPAWSPTKATNPKYRTRAHREARARFAPIVAAGNGWCVEAICLVERDGGSRWIPPGSTWHTAHDPTGTVYLGPAHQRCNTSEGATRGNRTRRTARNF